MAASSALNKNDTSAADETTALLAASSAGPTIPTNEEPLVHESRQEPEDDTPLPRLQIFLLCLARIVDPIAFFSVFPFISQMIWETGNIAQSDVGFYAGLIVNSPMMSRVDE